jgi:ABC-type uncharacterized transport system permease subunit
MPNLLLSFVAFVAYSLLSVYFWRAHTRGECDELCRGTIGHSMVIPITMHGYLLEQGIFSDGGFDLNVFNALSLIVWLTLLVYWVARFFYPIGGLQALVLPLAAVTLLLPGVFPADHQLAHTDLLAFRVHIAVAMLAYSLFTIAMLHAVLISLVEKRLHHATLPRVLRSLPPLLTMESLLFRMIGIGFVARRGSSITRCCSALSHGVCSPCCCGDIVFTVGVAKSPCAGRSVVLPFCC